MGLIPISDEHLHEVCKCGKCGKGAECCIYPVAGEGGIQCARNTELKAAFEAKADRGEMVAQARGEDCTLWQV